MLRAHLDDGLSREIGIAIGARFAEYATAMPRVETHGNWYGYLSNYGEFGLGAALEDQRHELDVMPLGVLGIAKNDGHLGNFLVASEQQIIGIDFAEARLKRLGWDMLLTEWRSLKREFGDAAKPVIDGLIKGWCDADPARDKATFRQLTRLFLRALDLLSARAKGPGKADWEGPPTGGGR